MSIPRHTSPRSARSGPLSRRRLLQGSAALAAGAAGAGTLASCGSARARPGATEIDYWLWDALQLPAYSAAIDLDRKSTRLNSSHVAISYAVFCLKKKT